MNFEEMDTDSKDCFQNQNVVSSRNRVEEEIVAKVCK